MEGLARQIAARHHEPSGFFLKKMTKASFLKNPIRFTELGVKVVQTRLSLKETQKEFANRFMVSPVTIWHWERGKVDAMRRIYKKILDRLHADLAAQDRLLHRDVVLVLFKEDVERSGDAEPPLGS